MERLRVAECEAVVHPRDVVHGAVDGVAALDEVLEDPLHRRAGPYVLGASGIAEVDALEHERAQGEHRGADLVALPDVTRARGGLDEVVDERVDPARPGGTEQLDLVLRELAGVEHAGAHRVVDVVVDVGHAVDQADDPSLERVRLVRPRVVEDPVADLLREVEPAAVALQHVDDPQRVLVVVEAAAEALLQELVQRLLTGMAERRVPEVVPEPDRLDEVLVEPQRSRHPARDPGRLERVRQPRAVVVAGRVDEHLRLVHEPPERLRVDDAVAVALERRAQQARLLLPRAPARLVGPDRQRREPALLVLANARFEGVSSPSGKLGHDADASPSVGQ